MKSFKEIVSVAVFLILEGTAFYLICQGPLSDVISGKTSMVQSLVEIGDLKTPIKWPTLMICKNPRDKSKDLFDQFMQKGMNKSFANISEFTDLRDKVFFTKPGELVYAIGASAGKYFETIQRATNKEILIEEPLVVTGVSDLLYAGFCNYISFEVIKEYLVKKGDRKDNEIAGLMNVNVWLQGNDEHPGDFLIRFIEDQELLMGVMPDKSLTKVKAGTVSILTLDISLSKYQSNCDSNVQILSDCINQAYDNLFGTDFNNFVPRLSNLTATVLSGRQELKRVTGCSSPCQETKYEGIPLVDWKVADQRDASLEVLERSGSNQSSYLAINYFPNHFIKVEEELPRYTVIKFISDVGGILGIFVGFSLWSFYSSSFDNLQAMLKKMY